MWSLWPREGHLLWEDSLPHYVQKIFLWYEFAHSKQVKFSDWRSPPNFQHLYTLPLVWIRCQIRYLLQVLNMHYTQVSSQCGLFHNAFSRTGNLAKFIQIMRFFISLYGRNKGQIEMNYRAVPPGHIGLVHYLPTGTFYVVPAGGNSLWFP